jgi:hypothetical protein
MRGILNKRGVEAGFRGSSFVALIAGHMTKMDEHYSLCGCDISIFLRELGV